MPPSIYSIYSIIRLDRDYVSLFNFFCESYVRGRMSSLPKTTLSPSYGFANAPTKFHVVVCSQVLDSLELLLFRNLNGK